MSKNNSNKNKKDKKQNNTIVAAAQQCNAEGRQSGSQATDSTTKDPCQPVEQQPAEPNTIRGTSLCLEFGIWNLRYLQTFGIFC